jgi:hypothetical protein
MRETNMINRGYAGASNGAISFRHTAAGGFSGYESGAKPVVAARLTAPTVFPTTPKRAL